MPSQTRWRGATKTDGQTADELVGGTNEAEIGSQQTQLVLAWILTICVILHCR